MSPGDVPLAGAAILVACAFIAPVAAAYGLGRFDQKRASDRARDEDLRAQSHLIHEQYAHQNRTFVRMQAEVSRLQALCLYAGVPEAEVYNEPRPTGERRRR